MGNRRESALTVLAAALALVVHLFAAGIASAEQLSRDGTIICFVASSTERPADGPQRPAVRLGDCCITACPLVAAGNSATGAIPINAPRRNPIGVRRIAGRGRRDNRRERTSARPRAPPSAI